MNTPNDKTQTAERTEGSLERVVSCECLSWANTRPEIMLMTGHHEACPQRGSIVKAAQTIIAALVKGMENWAADEDGIHPDAWEAYKRGKVAIGQFDWKEEEAANEKGQR